MKFLMNILALAAIGAAGYIAEPHLRTQLTGLSSVSGSSGTIVNGVFTPSDPAIAAKLSGVDFNSLNFEQLPAEITLKADADVTDADTGLKMTLRAGNRVKPLRIEKGEAVFSPGAGNFEGRIPLGYTDLVEKLAANPPTAAAEVAPEPMPVEEAPAAPEPVEPAPAPEPEPAPEPVAAAFAPATPEEIVKTMQESIQSGQIQEFKFDQVTEWKAAEIETVDGEQFNTGLLSYQGETFLGVKSIQAKAFIRGGKVVRWIMPKSGMEIK